MRPSLGLEKSSSPKPKPVWKRRFDGSKLNFIKAPGTPVGWSQEDDSRKVKVIEAKFLALRSGNLT